MLGCYQSLDLCAIRASLLEADGSRTGSLANGSAYNIRPITLSSSANITTGDTIEQRDGCGNICASITDPDALTGYSLVLVSASSTTSCCRSSPVANCCSNRTAT